MPLFENYSKEGIYTYLIYFWGLYTLHYRYITSTKELNDRRVHLKKKAQASKLGKQEQRLRGEATSASQQEEVLLPIQNALKLCAKILLLFFFISLWFSK